MKLAARNISRRSLKPMIFFTVFFFAMLIIVSVSAVGGYAFYLKRRAAKLRAAQQKPSLGEPPPYHSLFEADERDEKF